MLWGYWFWIKKTYDLEVWLRAKIDFVKFQVVQYVGTSNPGELILDIRTLKTPNLNLSLL